MIKRKSHNLDEALLRRAKRVLGTKTETDAIHEALRAVLVGEDFRRATRGGRSRSVSAAVRPSDATGNQVSVKLLFDTNVYFHLLHDRRVLDRYREILAKVSPRLHLSSVVLLELIQAARGELSRARIRRAVREFERVGRVVAPLHTDWQRAGDVQGRIWGNQPRPKGRGGSDLMNIRIAFANRCKMIS